MEKEKKRILEKWSLIALHFNRARDSLMALMLSNEFETWRVILHEFCVSSPVGEISVLWTDVFHSFQFYGGSRIFYPYMVRSRLVFLKGQPLSQPTRAYYAWWEKVEVKIGAREKGHFSIPAMTSAIRAGKSRAQGIWKVLYKSIFLT